ITVPNASCVHRSSPARSGFGSQSEQGALTREILMSVLLTLSKRTRDPFGVFKRTLDALAQDEKRDPYRLLFDSS
ncbi:MAG TPA: hypothetical protein VH595_09085, partial [Verrucomicrobiae bacterium]|nr:hypothetical protein [Verrucomicrobiae bacterium]